jgi:hypothetical protein
MVAPLDCHIFSVPWALPTAIEFQLFGLRKWLIDSAGERVNR